MADTPLISVLMAAYREPLDQFSQALDSVLNQTYTNKEIVLIVDDPENVGLIKLAKEYAQHNECVRLHVNARNLGLAQSLNRAIDMVQGEYLCRMDSDDISLPERLEKQLEFLTEHECDLVGGQVSVIDSEGGWLYDAGAIPSDPVSINSCLRFNNSIPHPTWFGKRKVFAKKYRDIDYCEDYDFLIRSALQGERLGNINEIVLKYRMSESSISRDNLYRQFLSQLYLTQEYGNGRYVDAGAMKDWISAKFTDKKAKNYERAHNAFNSAMGHYSGGSKLKALLVFMKMPFISYGYMRKLYRLMRVKMAASH